MDTSESLQRRIALARPQDARTHGLHFEDTLGALGELFGEEVARVARECVPLTIDALPYGCPVADLLRLFDIGALAAGQRLGIPYADVLERLGALAWRGYVQSPLGKALWQRSSREPHEALSRSMTSARAAVNFGLRRYERLGPTRARLIHQNDFMGPAWTRGLFAQGLQHITQRPVSVGVEELKAPGLDFHLHISW